MKMLTKWYNTFLFVIGGGGIVKNTLSC